MSEPASTPSSPPPAPTPLDDAKPDAKHDPYAPFRHRAFLIYLSSYMLAVVSSAMLSFSAKYEINELTKRASLDPAMYLGILGAVGAVPIIGFSLIAGHIVDRFNRKTVLMVTQVILSICPGLFALLAWYDTQTVWTVYGIVLINGTALTFARPARSALISTIVPRNVLATAITWNSTFFETCAISAPLIAGFMIGGPGLAVALWTSAACMFACLIISIALPRPPVYEPDPNEPGGWQKFLTGFRFVFHTRLLFAVMALDLFAVLFGGATYLLPMFADQLGVGVTGLKWMVAGPGIGAISMALIQSHRPPLKRAGRAMLIAVAGFGLVTIAFGLSKNIYLSIGLLVLLGALDNISVIVRHSLVQLLTPDAMRGRVSAVNQVFIGSSNELGGFESGLTARLFGSITASVVFGGVAVMAVVGVIAGRYPEVRKLGRLRDVAPTTPDPDAAADPKQVTTQLQSTT